jgi:hypothetical protein
MRTGSILCFAMIAGCGTEGQSNQAVFSDDGTEAAWIWFNGDYDAPEYSVQLASVSGDALVDIREVTTASSERLQSVFHFKSIGRILINTGRKIRVWQNGVETKTVELRDDVGPVLPSHEGRYLYIWRDLRTDPSIFDLDTEVEHTFAVPKTIDRAIWDPDGRLILRTGSSSELLDTYAVRFGEEPVLDESGKCYVVDTSSGPLREDGRELLSYSVPPKIIAGRMPRCR